MKFETSIDRKQIAIGDKAQLGLTFYETQNMPAPDIGNIDGLEVRYVGPSTMMTVVNGCVSSSVTHIYALIPLRVGKFELGPFSFEYKGDTYTSNTASLEAVEERPTAMAGAPSEEAVLGKLDLEDRIFLTLNMDKTKAYVNELIPVVVKLYVALNVSDIQLPTFEQEGFSKVEFKEPKRYKEEAGGMIYDVLEFKTYIFGTRPGDYRLGPAKIKCNVMVKKRVSRGLRDDFFNDSFFEDFMSRYERYPVELKSQDVPIVISPLPDEGRPSGDSGTIGDYQFIYNANPKKVKVGDPITLTMEINGGGNLNTVLMPKLDSVEGFKVYEPQIQTRENSKVFKLVLIPETDKISQIPGAVFTYFDPNKRRYMTIQQGPIPIQVEKGREEAPAQVVGPRVSLPSVPTEEELGRDIIYIKESPGTFLRKGRYIYRNKLFLALLGIPLIFLISFYIYKARQNKLKQDTAYAGRLRALKFAKRDIKLLKNHIKTNDKRAFYEALFKTLQDYLGNRLDIPSGGITLDITDSMLVPKGIDIDIISKLKNIFHICDQARFALSDIDELRMGGDLKELEEVIKYFEHIKT